MLGLRMREVKNENKDDKMCIDPVSGQSTRSPLHNWRTTTRMMMWYEWMNVVLTAIIIE
jgi:hypothetical protein